MQAISFDVANVVWKVGTVQLLVEARHAIIVRFARENTNVVAGSLVAEMLKSSADQEKTCSEALSLPLSLRDIMQREAVQNALPKGTANKWKILANYAALLCRDNCKVLEKVENEGFDASGQTHGVGTTSDGGKFVVHMKNVITELQYRTLHAMISDKFGVASARIMKILLDFRQLEQKQIGDYAMLPSAEVRRRLCAMFAAGWVKMQEVPKRSDYNPQQTFFCWSVDLVQVYENVRNQLCHTLVRLRTRRSKEMEQGQDLIDRSDDLVEKADITRFDELSRSLDRLDMSLLRLQEMLLLFSRY